MFSGRKTPSSLHATVDVVNFYFKRKKMLVEIGKREKLKSSMKRENLEKKPDNVVQHHHTL